MNGNLRSPLPRFSGQQLVSCLLVVSAILNAVLAYRLHRQELKFLRKVDFVVGDEMPVFTAAAISGTRATALNFQTDGRLTVLYWFSPKCYWCVKNINNMKSIAAAAGDRFTFLAVAPEDETLPEFIEKHGLHFPIYTLSPEEQAKSLLGATPKTIVVGPDGRIQRSWRGSYNERLKPIVEEVLSVSLPDAVERPRKQQAVAK